MFNILNICYLNYFSYLCKVVLCTLFHCFFSIFWPKVAGDCYFLSFLECKPSMMAAKAGTRRHQENAFIHQKPLHYDGKNTFFEASRLWAQRAGPALLRATYLRQPSPQMADGGTVTTPRIDGGTVSAGTQKTRQDLLPSPSAGHFRGYRRALMRDDARLIATMHALPLPCVPMHAPLLKMVVSLHLKTVGKWPISDSFSQSALSFDDVALARQSKQASSALTLRNVRSAFALASLERHFRKRRLGQVGQGKRKSHSQDTAAAPFTRVL